MDRLGNDEWWINKAEYKETNLTLSLSESEKIKCEIQCEKVSDEKYVIKNAGIIEIKTEGEKQKAIFKLDENIKKKRLKQILTVLKNGLIYHSSGENYGIVPKFLIAAGLEIPVPLFHYIIELGDFKDSV